MLTLHSYVHVPMSMWYDGKTSVSPPQNSYELPFILVFVLPRTSLLHPATRARWRCETRPLDRRTGPARGGARALRCGPTPHVSYHGTALKTASGSLLCTALSSQPSLHSPLQERASGFAAMAASASATIASSCASSSSTIHRRRLHRGGGIGGIGGGGGGGVGGVGGSSLCGDGHGGRCEHPFGRGRRE